MKPLCTSLLWLAATVVNSEITFPVSNVDPLPLEMHDMVQSASELFSRSCPEEVADKNPYKAKVILSSYSEIPDDPYKASLRDTYASSGSFVRGSIVAWANHQSLVLRPDVIWFEILAQLNFYMTKNAEAVRDLFVTFNGKKEIVVKDTSWQNVISAFGTEIQKRVKTDWLLSWVTPGFSTSTRNDNLTATVMLMGLTKHYFEFTGGIICGIPRVTLLGTKGDWARLYSKLDHLRDFGEEPSQFADKLQPILKRFVQTWEEPNSPVVQSFWRQIVRANRKFSCGGGPDEYDISGWVTGFMQWKSDGTLRDSSGGAEADEDAVRLDDIAYSRVSVDQIPVGYAKAPIRMLDYPGPGMTTSAYVLAGNIGVRRTENDTTKEVLAEPLNSWFLYGPVSVNYTTGPEYGNFSEVEGVASPLNMFCPAAAM